MVISPILVPTSSSRISKAPSRRKTVVLEVEVLDEGLPDAARADQDDGIAAVHAEDLCRSPAQAGDMVAEPC
jgi:hypothetical protein